MQWFNPSLAYAADEINRLPNLHGANHYAWGTIPEMFYDVFTRPKPALNKPGNVFGSIGEEFMQTIFAAEPTHICEIKSGKQRQADKMLAQACRSSVVFNFASTSTRVTAIYSKEPAISSRFRPLNVGDNDTAKAFVAFLNSSFGILQLLNMRSRKLVYARYKPGQLRTMKLPNPAKADLAPLLDAFEQVKNTPLQRLSQCAQDPARQTLDHAAAQTLGVAPALTDQWRKWLSHEPTITNKPYQP